jgi:hypothetical protein
VNQQESDEMAPPEVAVAPHRSISTSVVGLQLITGTAPVGEELRLCCSKTVHPDEKGAWAIDLTEFPLELRAVTATSKVEKDFNVTPVTEEEVEAVLGTAGPWNALHLFLSPRKTAQYVNQSPLRADPTRAGELLKAIRARADSWRTGTAVALGVVTGALTLGNTKDSVQQYDAEHVRLMLASALLVSAALGMWSLYKMVRAGHGAAWFDVRRADNLPGIQESQRDLALARMAAHDLYWGQRLLAASILIFILIVAAVWVLPKEAAWPW